jgi:hypothetical protein
MSPFKASVVAMLTCLSTPALAQATYDVSSGQLLIPSVSALGTTYTGLTLQNLGNYTFQLRTAYLQQPPGQALATYEAGSGVLVLPVVSVGSTNYFVRMQNIGNYTFQLTWADYALPQSYATLQAWVNFISTPQTYNFTMSGTLNGFNLAGSYGSFSFGSLSPATFNGKSALAQSLDSTIHFFNGSVSSSSQRAYVDANYQPVGHVSTGQGNTTYYEVLAGPATIPEVAQVGSSGTICTYTVYSSSSMTSVTGIDTLTYAVQPDPNSSTSAIFVVTSSMTNPSGGIIQTVSDTFRVAPSGNLTWRSESIVYGANSITITAN